MGMSDEEREAVLRLMSDEARTKAEYECVRFVEHQEKVKVKLGIFALVFVSEAAVLCGIRLQKKSRATWKNVKDRQVHVVTKDLYRHAVKEVKMDNGMLAYVGVPAGTGILLIARER